MTPPIMLTDEQKQLFSYINSIMPEDGHLVFDLRDEKQYEFARLSHLLIGRKPEDYPGLYCLLDDIRARQEATGQVQFDGQAEDEGWVDSVDIPGVGTVTPSLAGANGLGTVVGGFKQMTLALYVQDTSNGNILATGNSQLYSPEVILPVETDDSAAQAAAANMMGYLSYTYEPSDGSPAQSGVVQRSSFSATTDPVVNEPARNSVRPRNPNAINIGLGRNWGDQGGQFDYVWNEPNVNNPQGRIPFVGNVKFDKQIKTLEPRTNFNLTINVADGTGGGTLKTITPTDLDHVYANFSIDPNDNTNLKWNLPSGVNDLNTGDPIAFTNITWPSDMLAYFYCAIQVTFTDNTLGFATISSSDDADQDPLDGTTYIMPIEFVWHCLGAGTKILCADKSERAIEDFKRGDEIIKNSEGGVGMVSSTNLGAHKGEVLCIVTDQGHELILSHKHVVITTNDPKLALELQAGDEVVVLDGTATITEVGVVENYKDLMGNLEIDEDNDYEIGTFFANGILVGDITAQHALKRQRASDKEWVKQASGEYWHTDIESFFAGK